METKKILAPVALLACGALSLTACAANNTPGATTNTTSSTTTTSTTSTSSAPADSPSASSAPSSDASSASSSSSSSAPAQQVQGTLSGSGATSQEQAMTAWKNGVKTTQPGLNVQYSAVGSGNGIKALLAGQVAFAGSDSALKPEEYEASKKICGPKGAFHVPAYVSPVAMAYNLDGVKDLKLDADTAAKIFKGQITKWNDPAIAALNAGATLPDQKITVVARSDESGTTDNFTDYLNKAAPTVWTDKHSKKWPVANQESAGNTSGVVKIVQGTKGAIGYADESAVGSLGVVQVKVGDAFVAPSAEAAAKVVEVSKLAGGMSDNDMAVKLDRATKEAGAYPIVLISYHVYCNQYKDQNTADMVKAFGKYAISADGQKAAQAAAKNAPLSQKLSTDAAAAIDKITVG